MMAPPTLLPEADPTVPAPAPGFAYPLAVQLLISACLLVGAIANVTSLCILHRSRRRNVKHVLLLRCLATNDLVAQVGMLLVLNLKRYHLIPNYWSCVGLVVLRGFGLGSGTVAFVMAFERWLALTRPFIYHQVVTYQTLKRILCCLWLAAVTLTYLPFFGFGLYYDTDKGECIRFRYASTIKDKVYAYTFFIFGATLCLSIALCNTAVVCELSSMRTQTRHLMRRTVNNRMSLRYQTPEEIAFAKLMAYICIIFIVCWAPQVISVPIAQLAPENKKSKIFTKMADILLSIYFTLDPFIYVLQRYIEKDRFFCCMSRQRSDGSIRTITTEAGSGTPTSVLMQPLNFPPENQDGITIEDLKKNNNN